MQPAWSISDLRTISQTLGKNTVHNLFFVIPFGSNLTFRRRKRLSKLHCGNKVLFKFWLSLLRPGDGISAPSDLPDCLIILKLSKCKEEHKTRDLYTFQRIFSHHLFSLERNNSTYTEQNLHVNILFFPKVTDLPKTFSTLVISLKDPLPSCNPGILKGTLGTQSNLRLSIKWCRDHR